MNATIARRRGYGLDRRRFLGGLAGAAATLGLTACGAGGEQPAGSGDTRRIQHPLGSTEIPNDPRRVIALDPGPALQVALEHGVPLVASATLGTKPDVPKYLPKSKQDFEHLGFEPPDPESLAELNPDLIVGHQTSLADNYEVLSQLSNVVAYENTRDNVEWQQSCLTVADYYGYRKRQQELIDRYAERAAEVKRAHADVLGKTRIALLRFTTDELRIVTDSVIFPSRVLSDCGVRRSESSAAADKGDTYNSLSLEQVSRLADADALIYFGGGGAFEGEQVNSTFTNYTEGTLWQRLPAVRAGKVFEVPQNSWWDGYSATAANKIVDELTEVLRKL
ncbi:iron complex transport system substrate-binding protein [Tamaricihabitans halophyticus]|uniref:Iron complex transport system substrate-binding protein n=1 Tax=Tamaricihabitans halophyticus TaxID=1262583 RepID=A0A4R2QXQ6_9PSEU|nr:ABC transporter substrate-binding protein [Tamaricihabitans halophyticus]TCP54980.1 iron complex transport system substrate-binding protein [Tamaricihabitans halophyticus]